MEKCRKNIPSSKIDPEAWVDHLTALTQLQLIEEEENHEPSEQQQQQQQHLQTPSTASTLRITDLNNGMIQNTNELRRVV